MPRRLTRSDFYAFFRSRRSHSPAWVTPSCNRSSVSCSPVRLQKRNRTARRSGESAGLRLAPRINSGNWLGGAPANPLIMRVARRTASAASSRPAWYRPAFANWRRTFRNWRNIGGNSVRTASPTRRGALPRRPWSLLCLFHGVSRMMRAWTLIFSRQLATCS